jgi:hypothetical protein
MSIRKQSVLLPTQMMSFRLLILLLISFFGSCHLTVIDCDGVELDTKTLNPIVWYSVEELEESAVDAVRVLNAIDRSDSPRWTAQFGNSSTDGIVLALSNQFEEQWLVSGGATHLLSRTAYERAVAAHLTSDTALFLLGNDAAAARISLWTFIADIGYRHYVPGNKWFVDETALSFFFFKQFIFANCQQRSLRSLSGNTFQVQFHKS